MKTPPWKRFLRALPLIIAIGVEARGQAVPVLPQAATKPATRSTTGSVSLAGDYLGSITAQGVTLRLGLKLESDGAAGLKGVLDSIDQRAKIPVDTVTLSGRTLKLELKRIAAGYEGKVADDGLKVEGTWTQAGGKLPLTFKRVEAAPALRRPQEPKPPYPYEEQEVVVENKAAGVRLGGTLTLPKGTSRKPKSLPAVLLITGSGQQDRDESLMGHRPFFVLADHLTRSAGVAVLRLDDRGCGKSTGDFSKATQVDFVADATAAVAFLRDHPDIDADRVGLLGHSEGALTAPLVAATDPKVAFVVMLAGPGVPMDQLLLRQGQDIARLAGMDAAMLRWVDAMQRKLFAAIKKTDDLAELERQLRAIAEESQAALPAAQREGLAKIREQLDGQIKVMLSPWYRHLVRHDPAPALQKVKCPVLAVCGEKDLQVAAKENLAAIKAALDAGGNRDVRIVELAGHNHLLQECKTGSLSEYGTIEQTMSPQALKAIADWIKSHTSR